MLDHEQVNQGATDPFIGNSEGSREAVYLLPLDGHVHEDGARVHDERVEKFDGTRLAGEGLDVVCLGLEVLKNGVGSGEAVGQLDVVTGQDVASSVETSILHALDEAEPVGALASGIDHKAVDLGGGTAGFVASRDHVHPFDIEFAVGAVSVDETLAVVSLELGLVLVGALLGVLGPVKSVDVLK